VNASAKFVSARACVNSGVGHVVFHIHERQGDGPVLVHIATSWDVRHRQRAGVCSALQRRWRHVLGQSRRRELSCQMSNSRLFRFADGLQHKHTTSTVATSRLDYNNNIASLDISQRQRWPARRDRLAGRPAGLTCQMINASKIGTPSYNHHVLLKANILQRSQSTVFCDCT